MALLHAGNDSEKLSMSGDEPPPEYLVKESRFGAIESSPEFGQIPIIDVSLFSPSSIDSKQAEIELNRLRSALSSSGCFQVIYDSYLNLLDREGKLNYCIISEIYLSLCILLIC
jgi:hypothetical protein